MHSFIFDHNNVAIHVYSLPTHIYTVHACKISRENAYSSNTLWRNKILLGIAIIFICPCTVSHEKMAIVLFLKPEI